MIFKAILTLAQGVSMVRYIQLQGIQSPNAFNRHTFGRKKNQMVSNIIRLNTDDPSIAAKYVFV